MGFLVQAKKMSYLVWYLMFSRVQIWEGKVLFAVKSTHYNQTFKKKSSLGEKYPSNTEKAIGQTLSFNTHQQKQLRNKY